ncbi:uncharacterized protein KGF55_005264 [Candida pseudojiufengensis]|uniref:uncharacterized protein n=1 Tax=Candida pseudojiufengensis TaxID=497109 RepID=UPI0022248563|nr:uncharacterized protein KGF55_005264 [Candida pseudojiufengensis]KAI5959620.1 hypothetical protein KGF55_005264 [Candida pseudojiufengensis]
MAILNKLLNLNISDNKESNKELKEKSIDEQIIQSGFEISDCSEICDDCTISYPKSLKFEETEPLWNSTKPFGLHLIISTGKSDWPHDATGIEGTLSNKISNWASEESGKTSIGNIKVTCSSLSNDNLIIDDDYINQKKGDVLIMPYFLWLRGIKLDEVDEKFNILLSIFNEHNLKNKELEKEKGEDNGDIVNNRKDLKFEYIKSKLPTIEEDINLSYIFFCSHKTRDKRCGITAPIMKKEMDLYLRDIGYYRDYGDQTPNGISVAFINHIGGHKFAANVIIYIKSTGQNIWLGLCKPNNCKPIIDQCILEKGKVWPNKVRILQKFDPIEW